MKRRWEQEDLLEHWTLSASDQAHLGNKTGATRLGFAVLLKFFQREGRFPAFKNEVPSVVIAFVAAQVGVDPSAYLHYDWQGRTLEYHRALIRKALGFRESILEDAEHLQHWMIGEALPQEHQEERLREQAYQWFRRQHLEAPAPKRLTRYLRSAAHTFEQQFYEATLARLPQATQAALEALVQAEPARSDEGRDREQAEPEAPSSKTSAASTLQQIRQDPGRVGLATMLEELTKLRHLRELQLPDDLFPGVARAVLAVYRNRASVEEPSTPPLQPRV
jgi:hypothetical protein